MCVLVTRTDGTVKSTDGPTLCLPRAGKPDVLGECGIRPRVERGERFRVPGFDRVELADRLHNRADVVIQREDRRAVRVRHGRRDVARGPSLTCRTGRGGGAGGHHDHPSRIHNVGNAIRWRRAREPTAHARNPLPTRTIIAHSALMSSLMAWALGIPNIVNAPPPTRHRPGGGWGGAGGRDCVCVPFSDPFCSHKMLFCSHKMAFWGSFCGYNIHFVATRWMTKPQVRALCGYKMVTKPWGSG